MYVQPFGCKQIPCRYFMKPLVSFALLLQYNLQKKAVIFLLKRKFKCLVCKRMIVLI
jgi:hypothetical protein